MRSQLVRTAGVITLALTCICAVPSSAADDPAPNSAAYQLQLADVQLPAGDGHPIDRLLAPYFVKHAVTPDASVSDERFARRVALDVLGIPPTNRQLSEFLGDQRADKRRHFVERLLTDRENYVGHWMTFWSDHLRIGSDIDAGAFDSDHSKAPRDWLKAQLDRDLPYDRFVQELIAGEFFERYSQSVAPSGEVASAVDIPEMQVATIVSQVFLGVQLKCASCHDSFIDRWTLEDAWGLASALGDREFEIHRCQEATGQKVGPKFPLVGLGEIDPHADQKQRRHRVAEIMTGPENGLFARTIVNRLWARLFGRGLVEPLDEMMEQQPWNVELLDWLAGELIRQKYDLKQILLAITTSKAYQLPAVVREAANSKQAYVFRGPEIRRQSAEQIIDALYVLGNPPPDNTLQIRLPQRSWQQDNNRLMIMLGRPGRDVVVTWREQDSTALVALELMNGPELQRLVQQAAEAQLKQSSAAPDFSLRVYWTLLARPPTAEEQHTAAELLSSLPNQETAQDLIWTIVMLPEFQLIP